MLQAASCRIRTNDPEITNHVLWPTELKRQVDERSASHSSTRYPCFGQDLGDLRGARRAGLTHCKVRHYFDTDQTFFHILFAKKHKRLIHLFVSTFSIFLFFTHFLAIVATFQ